MVLAHVVPKAFLGNWRAVWLLGLIWESGGVVLWNNLSPAPFETDAYHCHMPNIGERLS